MKTYKERSSFLAKATSSSKTLSLSLLTVLQVGSTTLQAQSNTEHSVAKGIGWLIAHDHSMPAYTTPKIDRICVPEGTYNSALDCSIQKGVPVVVHQIIGTGDTAVAKVTYPSLDAHKKTGQGGFMYIPLRAGIFHESLDGVDVYQWHAVSSDQFSKKVRQYDGSSYVWGGNLDHAEMEKGFPVLEQLSSHDSTNIAKGGIDCSGLYSASLMDAALVDTLSGSKIQENPALLATLLPSGRNTSELLWENDSVAIYNKNLAGIAHSLQVGDYMVWNGHMIIVVENQQGKLVWAESRYPDGYQEVGLLKGLKKEAHDARPRKLFVNPSDYDHFYAIYLGQHKTYKAVKKMYQKKKQAFSDGHITKKELKKRQKELEKVSHAREKPTLVRRTYPQE